MKKGDVPIAVLEHCSKYLKVNYNSFKNAQQFTDYIDGIRVSQNLSVSNVDLARAILTYTHEVTMFGQNNQSPGEFWDQIFNRNKQKLWY